MFTDSTAILYIQQYVKKLTAQNNLLSKKEEKCFFLLILAYRVKNRLLYHCMLGCCCDGLVNTEDDIYDATVRG